MAVSSGGGHWAELCRLKEAWAGATVTYVVTQASYHTDVAKDPAGANGKKPHFFTIPDANKSEPLRLVFSALSILLLIIRIRPDVVISTGAAPGYFAIRFGKLFRARTIWVDSIANAEEVSVSAKLAQPYSDMYLTQWPHLAQPNGPQYKGSVM